jgi:hypothetical protein
MASVTTNIEQNGAAAVPFSDALVRVLERMAQLSPTYRRVAALSHVTDAELAAQGTTRQDAATRVFGSRFYA